MHYCAYLLRAARLFAWPLLLHPLTLHFFDTRDDTRLVMAPGP
jgi:hypothetical protein